MIPDVREKRTQQFGAFLFQNPASDKGPMIKTRILQQIHQCAATSGFRVISAKKNRFDS